MTVRICRLCGTFAALEPCEDTPAEPHACPDCLSQLLARPWIPDWVVRQVRRLRALS